MMYDDECTATIHMSECKGLRLHMVLWLFRSVI